VLDLLSAVIRVVESVRPSVCHAKILRFSPNDSPGRHFSTGSLFLGKTNNMLAASKLRVARCSLLRANHMGWHSKWEDYSCQLNSAAYCQMLHNLRPNRLKRPDF